MSTETTLTPRQQLIDTLCGDLNVQGWNQKNKLWYVKGATGDEWLEFAGEFSGAPENHLVDLIAKAQTAPDVTGLVVSSEGWAYPKKLAETFKTESALRAYWRLVPPSEHPEKVEIRHLLFASTDGEVLGLTAHNDTDGTKEWAFLTGDQKCPTGDRTVDAARAVLGLNEPLKQRVLNSVRKPSPSSGGLSDLAQFNEQLQNLLGTLQAVVDGRLTPPQATLQLFYSMPEQTRIEMIREMPESIRAEFRELLPEEERKKYGL